MAIAPEDWLNDAEALRQALASAVRAGSFTPLESVVVKFQPHGVTACVVVGESHLALHTWPEEGRLYFEAVSCSTERSVSAAVETITSSLPAGKPVLVDRRTLDPDASTVSEKKEASLG